MEDRKSSRGFANFWSSHTAQIFFLHLCRSGFCLQSFLLCSLVPTSASDMLRVFKHRLLSMAVVIQHQPLSIPETCNFTDVTSFYLRPVPFLLWAIHFVTSAWWHGNLYKEDFWGLCSNFLKLCVFKLTFCIISLRWINSINSEAFMFLWWILPSFGR